MCRTTSIQGPGAFWPRQPRSVVLARRSAHRGARKRQEVAEPDAQSDWRFPVLADFGGASAGDADQPLRLSERRVRDAVPAAVVLE